MKCLVCVALLVSLQAAFAEEPVKIGGIFCLTGEIASGCSAIREGAEVALDVVRQEGKIQGREIVLDIQDSKYTSRESNSLAVRFAGDPLVLGVLITGILETKAAAAVLERARLTNITLWDSAPEIEAMGDYEFGIGPWLPSSYERSAEFAFNDLKAKSAAIISINAEWSLAVSGGFEKHFRQIGGEVISNDSMLPHESDFRTVLARIIKKNPDVIYAPITQHLIPFFRQVRELGYKGKVVTSDNLTDEIISQAPEVFEGVYQSMVADPDTAESQRLKDLYQKKFNRPAQMLVFHAWGYDGVRLMAEALRKSDLTRESVRAALLSIKDFPGANGSITLNAEGSWRMMVKMFRVESGKLKKLE